MQLTAFDNGVVERLIGSIRRESVDHMIVLGEAHLRRILKSYARYYNGVRTHRSLNKDAPVSRSVQRTGVIRSRFITIIVGFKFSVHTRFPAVETMPWEPWEPFGRSPGIFSRRMPICKAPIRTLCSALWHKVAR